MFKAINVKKLVHVALLLLVLFSFFGAFSPTPSNAAGVDGGGSSDGVSGGGSTGGVDGGGTEPVRNYGSAEISNFLTSPDIRSLIFKIIDIVLVILLPIIILYIMYAGFLFVMAAGNPGKVSEARTALMNAVIGGVIVFGARVLVDIIEATITSL